MTDDPNNLSGYILESPFDVIERHHLTISNVLAYQGRIGTTAWERFTYASPTPLRQEDPSLVAPPYHYPIIARRSRHRILVLSFSTKVIEYLLHNTLKATFRSPLKHVPIAVDALVKALTAKPTNYVLSFAHSRVPAFGVSLRAISYYGEDLAEASLFRDSIPLTQFFTCGLRLAAGGAELVRLGSEGMISFYYRDENTIRDVEKALSFLYKAGYLTADILKAREG
jgi:hypothetical protein